MLTSLSIVSAKEMLRNPLVYGLAIIFPLCFSIMFFFMPDITMKDGVVLSGVAFGIPAVFLFVCLSIAFSGTAAPITQLRADGILKSLGMTPVSRAIYLLSHLPIRIVLCFAVFLITLGVLIICGEFTSPDWLNLAGGFVVAVSTCLSLGIALAARTKNPGLVGGLGGMITPILMFVSGGFLPLSMLPEWVTTIARFIPFSYAVDALRASMTNANPEFSPVLGFAVCAVWTVFLGVLAARAFIWDSTESK